MDRLVVSRFFRDSSGGVLVEVGAARPDFLSVGASFRQRGWTVISVEPNPEFCELHRAAGNHVLQYACGDHDEDGVEFSVVDSGGVSYRGDAVSYESFSSLAIKDRYAELVDSRLDVRKITVDLRRLDTLLAEHAPEVRRIDLVAVDVEGWELEVLDGLDFERYAPRALIVENLFGDRRYRRYMRDRGYRLWRYVEPNDVYAPRDELRPGDRVTGTISRLQARRSKLAASLYSRLGRAGKR